MRPATPSPALWSDEGDAPRGPGNQFGNLPFATYRTLCVRLCDGYYFPVSFSTLPNHFQRDAELCQSRCAAPAELLLPPKPRRRRRAGDLGRQPAALHQLEIGLALSQRVRAGLLLQGSRICCPPKALAKRRPMPRRRPVRRGRRPA